MKALEALLLPLVALCMCCTAVVVAADRNAGAVKGLKSHAGPLVTSYYEVSEPTVQPSNRTAVRPGRTALAITFSEPAVSKHMAVIVPTRDGMVHDAVDSWQAHKNLAVMFKSLKSINAQSDSNQPHLFPKGTIALQAAGNAATPGQRDVQGLLGVLDASGKRPAWATETPSSLMLWPYDQPSGAVADLIDVSYDEPSGLVTLEVDVVDNPHTITEFTPHQRQTMDVNKAHYHFNTRPGVNIDAPALLKSLATPDHKVKGLLVFVKEGPATCWYVDITASPSTTATVGSEVTVTFSNIIVDCDICRIGSCPPPPPPIDARSSNLTWTDSGTEVAFTVTGPATIVDKSEYSDPTRTGVQQTASSVEGVAQTVNGEAWVKLRVDGPGPINLMVDSVFGALAFEPNDITVTGVTPSSVAKLVLLPVKAYRHVHDSIILTVTAVDASYAPVANANVSVSAFGDCQPVSANTLVTTDAHGRADVTLGVDRPGAMAVVAAAVNGQGVAVLSEPANVIFFEDHGYIDDRERDYYGGEGGHEPGGHHYEGDAQSYAKAAAARAVQQLGTAVST